MAQGPLLSAAGLTRENVIYDQDGNMYIPASQRPDGSWRKAKRVKEGYIPPDEIPVYQSKGRQMEKDMPKVPAGEYSIRNEGTRIIMLDWKISSFSDVLY